MHMRAVVMCMILRASGNATAGMPGAGADNGNDPSQDRADQRQEDDGVKQTHPLSLSSN
jgi:hypothetical protein